MSDETRQFGSVSNAGTLRDRLRAAKAKQQGTTNALPNHAVIDDGTKQKIIDITGSQPTSVNDRYAAAVELARNDLRDLEYVDDKLFKETIDKYFSDFQGEEGQTGKSLRGEDNIIAMAKEGIDTFNNDIIGAGGDWLWDNSIAQLINAFNPENKAEDWVNKEDVGALASMAEDLALTLGLGPAGIALAAGKNAIQNSDDLAKAISKQDNITGERISDGQQLASGLSFGLNTALSAIPGIGVMKNVGKIAGKTASKGIKEATGDALKNYGKSLKTGGTDALWEVKNLAGRGGNLGRAGRNLVKGISGESGYTLSNMEKAAAARSAGKIPKNKGVLPGTPKNVRAAIKAANEKKLAKSASRNEGVKIADDATGLERAKGKIKNGAIKGMSSTKTGAINALTGVPLVVASQGLNDAAENGTDLMTAIQDKVSLDNLANAAILPLLLRRSYKKLPNLNGTSQRITKAPRLPFNVARAAAFSQVGSDTGETSTNLGNKGMTPDEVLADLLEYYGG